MFQSTNELENTDEGALRVAIQQLQFTILAPAATAGAASDAGVLVLQLLVQIELLLSAPGN